MHSIGTIYSLQIYLTIVIGWVFYKIYIQETIEGGHFLSKRKGGDLNKNDELAIIVLV
jgi:hypothetical protein